jgi:hypothetical protein
VTLIAETAQWAWLRSESSIGVQGESGNTLLDNVLHNY